MFLKFISRWTNNLYKQCLLFNFRIRFAVFYEQTLNLTPPFGNISEIYMCLLGRDIHWNKHVFCSDEYISPQIRNLRTKHFLIYLLIKSDTKIHRVFFKCATLIICNNITCMHIPFRQPCLFIYQQTVTCLMNIETFNG